MDLVNQVFKKCLDKLVIVFIDDVLIYPEDEHLNIVLELIREEQLHAKFSKCELWFNEAQFLRGVVITNGVLMDPAKIEVVSIGRNQLHPHR